MSAVNQFDFVSDITHGKTGFMDDDNEREYSQFFVNRALSMFADTILLVDNIMQPNGVQISNRMHFDYLFHAVKPKKRFGKWPKQEIDDDTKLVMEFFGVNRTTALQYIRAGGENFVETIKTRSKKGGRIKNEYKR